MQVDASYSDLVPKAETAMTRALTSASLQASETSTVYGNDLGMRLIRDKEASDATIARLEAKFEATSAKIERLEDTVARGDLERDFLKICSDGCLAIRSRYIDVYRRDILGVTTGALAGIQTGNEAAHSGDAFVDAMLYEKGLRNDSHLLASIYGLDCHTILDLRKLFAVLTLHKLTYHL